MLCLSSKKSLLSGVFAVVLATSVGVSGALAQAVDYTHSSGNDIWADGATERTTTTSTDMGEARAGDNLTIESGTVDVSATTRANARRIGILQSGLNGAGKLGLVSSGAANIFDISVTIGEIRKQGNRAVNLELFSTRYRQSSMLLSVTGDATVHKLDIELTSADQPTSDGRALFNGNLTVEDVTEIDAGNSSTGSIDATLELKGALNKFAGDITLDDQAGGRAYLTLSGGSDQSGSALCLFLGGCVRQCL